MKDIYAEQNRTEPVLAPNSN